VAKVMHRCLISLLVVLVMSSFAVAGEVHPGLKNAIDNGDYKMAKNLVEKVGVRDIYCPPSLKVKDAEKVYAQLLAEDPMAILRGNHLSYGFADEYLKVNCNGKKDYNYQICESLYDPIVRSRLNQDSLLGQWLHDKQGICLSKETIKACKYFYDYIGDDSLKMEVLRILDQKKLLKYTETVEEKELGPCVEKKKKDFDRGRCFREAERRYRNAIAECNKRQRHADLCRSAATHSNTDAERACENGGTERVCSSKTVKKKVVVEPFLYDIMSLYRAKFKNWQEMDDAWVKDVSLLRKYINEDEVINNLIREYKDKGDLDIRQLVGSCKLTPNFDKKIQKKVGFELFSCKDILAKYPIACNENNDGIRSFKTTLYGADSIAYACVGEKWKTIQYGENCGEARNGIVWGMYMCTDGKWKDIRIDSKCDDSKKGMVLGTYACDSVWKYIYDAHIVCNESMDSVKIFEPIAKGEQPIMLACDGNWRNLNELEKDNGICNNSKKGKVAGIYVCDSVWKTIFQLELAELNCENDSEIQSKYNQEITYKCDNRNWIVSIKDNKMMMVDGRDGKLYKIASIGGMTWMAENLNYEYNDDSGETECFENSSDSCSKYGRLYTWNVAIDGACPSGWHLPDTTEWVTLFAAVGRNPYSMQSKGFSAWDKATDEYGFSAVPAGCRGDDCYSSVGRYANIWTATEYDYNRAYFWGVWPTSAGYAYFAKYNRFSVRCVKD